MELFIFMAVAITVWLLIFGVTGLIGHVNDDGEFLLSWLLTTVIAVAFAMAFLVQKGLLTI